MRLCDPVPQHLYALYSLLLFEAGLGLLGGVNKFGRGNADCISVCTTAAPYCCKKYS